MFFFFLFLRYKELISVSAVCFKITFEQNDS